MKLDWLTQTSLLYSLWGSSRLGVNIIITWPQFNSTKRGYCDITVIGGRVRLKSSLQTISWVSWLLPAFKQAHMTTMNGTKLLWWLWAVIWPDIPSLFPCLRLRTLWYENKRFIWKLWKAYLLFTNSSRNFKDKEEKTCLIVVRSAVLPTHVSSFRTMTHLMVYNKTMNYFSQRGVKYINTYRKSQSKIQDSAF